MPLTMKRLLVLLMAVAFASAVDAGPARAAPATFTSTAINQAGGNCMDVRGSAAANGLQLITWSCNGGANQNFTFVPVSGTADWGR